MSADVRGYVLGIDLGTSGPKVALVSSRGEVIDWEFEPTALELLPGGGAEQDPRDWWRAIDVAARRLLDREAVPRERVYAIGVTAQWSGTVAVDEGGRALGNAVIWMDSRGARYIDDLVGGKVRFEGYGVRKLFDWLRITGGLPTFSGKDPIAHILFLREQDPERFGAARCFLEPKDYLNLLLTGRTAATFDSIALHWLTDNRDLENVRYHPRLLGHSTLSEEKLPPLIRATDLLGPLVDDVARAWGLRSDVQVVGGTPDVQSAAVGSGAVLDHQSHLYIGTSSWLTCHVPYKKTDIFHNMASLPSALPGRYFVANTQETAGACITSLLDNIVFAKDALGDTDKPDDAYARLDAAAAGVDPGSDKLIFLPWLYGERTPVDDSSLRGGFFNQSLHTTRAHMSRAVLEGVAYNSRWLKEHVEGFIGRPLERLRFIGGGAKSDLWCQIHADVLNVEVEKVKDPILANVRGAALIASLAMRTVSLDDIAAHVEVERVFKPDPAHRRVYDELFEVFLDLHKQNKRIFARLNAS